MMTTRKTPAKPRATKPKAYYVRNIHNRVVHVRYGKHKDPEQLNLNPRGTPGDIGIVDAQYANDGSFLAGIDTLYEVITETEANQAKQSYVLPTRQEKVEVVTDADSTILTAPNWDGKGRNNPLQQTRTFGATPAYADIPGSDTPLHNALREEAKAQDPQSVLPPNAFPQKVVVEKASGGLDGTNQHTLK
jgi:hypothetical protein